MTSNNSRSKNQIHNNNTMNIRIHFLIYSRGTNRNLSIKLITRHYTTRYLLCSSPLPLCTKNRSSICNLCSYLPLIPTNIRCNPSPTMSKSSILHDVHWGKYNILPSTFLRSKRYTSTILRLSRCNDSMKCYFFCRIYNCIRRTTSVYFHYLRSTSCPTKSNCQTTYAFCNGMKRNSSSRLP